MVRTNTQQEGKSNNDIINADVVKKRYDNTVEAIIKLNSIILGFEIDNLDEDEFLKELHKISDELLSKQAKVFKDYYKAIEGGI